MPERTDTPRSNASGDDSGQAELTEFTDADTETVETIVSIVDRQTDVLERLVSHITDESPPSRTDGSKDGPDTTGEDSPLRGFQ